MVGDAHGSTSAAEYHQKLKELQETLRAERERVPLDATPSDPAPADRRNSSLERAEELLRSADESLALAMENCRRAAAIAQPFDEAVAARANSILRKLDGGGTHA